MLRVLLKITYQAEKKKSNCSQPLNMLDQILHIQKLTCHSTKKMMEGIFQFRFHYQLSYGSFCSPIHHYGETMSMLGLK